LTGLWPATVDAQTVPVPQNLWRLEQQEDTDGDHRITIHDQLTPFVIQDGQAAAVRTVSGVYGLSVLLQELKRAEKDHRPALALEDLRLAENVVDRVHRLIKDNYWDALTRRVDAEHLDQVLKDSKVRSKYDYLYVPLEDEIALRYFKKCEQDATERKRWPALKVVPLPQPDRINAAFLRNLDGKHGLLSLKLERAGPAEQFRGIPYVVPGGRFNELYYWDSYFIILGLLQDGRTDLARGTADNLIYEIQNFGKVPNANRSYYLTRSQPPLLTSIIRALYAAKVVDREWLEAALKTALAEYRDVWMRPEHVVKIGPHRLNRYYDLGEGPCPEVEPGHYDEKLIPWMERAGGELNSPGTMPNPQRFLNEYLYCGSYHDVMVRGITLDAFFKHDRALRESGHDTTHRFDDRTADFLPCDLNAFLYKYEMDFAELLRTEFGDSLASLGPGFGKAEDWLHLAQTRKEAMWELMWDEANGFFFDYDYTNRKRSTYISATGLFPLWAGMLEKGSSLERERAVRVAGLAKRKLERLAGLAATARESVEAAATHDLRQWDFPFGWPPHQMLAWQGLRNCGLEANAERLAYRWLYTIVKNAHDFNGTIPEKFNVETGSHEVFAEYGNVGAKFDYIAPEGFGWMNASFEVGLTFLTERRLDDLRKLQPPPRPLE
jgi:alpha,alpha-trehalase